MKTQLTTIESRRESNGIILRRARNRLGMRTPPPSLSRTDPPVGEEGVSRPARRSWWHRPNSQSCGCRLSPWLQAVLGYLALSWWFGGDGQAAVLVWTNTAGGHWNVAANWRPNQVPSANDTAAITNYAVTVDGDVTVGG